MYNLFTAKQIIFIVSYILIDCFIMGYVVWCFCTERYNILRKIARILFICLFVLIPLNMLSNNLFNRYIVKINPLIYILSLLIFIIDEFLIIKYNNHSLSKEAFDVAMSNINDTVVIISSQASILYHNNTRLSSLLNIKSIYKKGKIDSIFLNDIDIKISYEERQLRLEKENDIFYATYIIKDIINKNNFIGTLIIIQDITEIYTHIADLTKKNDEIKQANKMLIEYTDALYVNKTKNERITLIKNISHSIGEHLNKLQYKTDEIIENILKDKCVYYEIKELEKKNQDLLKNIRKVVKLYKK